ncbi:hypothetical protein U9M48_020566 [Paspalum notatum var. saurae]|uniref:Uncharacterized protein n=1 Tax=Paspalum notatum var. saurae TaxID=547442 RepID=A0AAQ3TF35_PASNO
MPSRPGPLPAADAPPPTAGASPPDSPPGGRCLSPDGRRLPARLPSPPALRSRLTSPAIAPPRLTFEGSNPYQTPPPASGQHGDQQSGQHIDPVLGDFVNNLFTSGGSGHNSNEPGAM